MESTSNGQLLMLMQTQQTRISQLEIELQNEKRKCSEMEQFYRVEKSKKNDEGPLNLRFRTNLLKNSPLKKSFLEVESEIAGIASEFLSMKKTVAILQEEIRKLKICEQKDFKAGLKRKRWVPGSTSEEMDKKCEELGMLEYKIEDEPRILKALIYDLKLKVAITFFPGMPAYILFMCVRHADYINDFEKVSSLLNNTIIGIREVIQKHDNLEVTTMWLANTCQLLNNFKQYSGEKLFQSYNTVKQNEQCLKNFPQSEIRQPLGDFAVWIYQEVIRTMRKKIQQLIIPAILENNMKSIMVGLVRQSCNVEPEPPLNCLLEKLSAFYEMFPLHILDRALVTQLVRHILYHICAEAINSLLVRESMCHWSIGMQIRVNVGHVERWCVDRNLHDPSILEPLQPIIQVSELLKTRKSNDEDVTTICGMCDKLSVGQIIQILTMYTPLYPGEERVSEKFISKIEEKLLESRNENLQAAFMDTEFCYPILIPFSPLNIQLEDIVIPQQLSLTMVKKI